MKTRTAGFSFVELTVALLLLVVAVTALVTGFVNSTRLSEDTRTTAILTVGMRNLIETLRDVPLENVPAQFGLGSGQNQCWCNTEGEISFADPGDAIASGTLEFFNTESAIPAEFATMGVGFDLNGNGVVETTPVTDCQVLPVRLTMTTLNPNTPRQMTFHYFLSELGE